LVRKRLKIQKTKSTKVTRAKNQTAKGQVRRIKEKEIRLGKEKVIGREKSPIKVTTIERKTHEKVTYKIFANRTA
jgi:hypothetical protein